jgi:hypothetical protein
MRLKWLGLAVAGASLCGGCLKNDGSRVDDLISRQSEQAQSISQLSEKVNSVEAKLANIEKGISVLLGGGSVGAAGKVSGPMVSSSFAKTEEYKNIMNQIALLQEQVVVVQGVLTGFHEERQENRELEELRDRGAAFRAMNEPQELTRRLDILAKNFSGKIPDAAVRNQFVNEIGGLKARYTAPMSPEQKKGEAQRLLTEAMNAVDNDRARGWLEAQLRSLDEQDNPEEIEERVNRTVQFQRMREIGELTRRYNIPAETVRDSGLVSFDQGGLPGFSRTPE